MSIVVADISISLDGFVTGPDPGLERGLGIGGEPLHTWAFSDDEVDRAVLAEATGRSGAVVMGRTLFDIIDGPEGWSDDVGYGAGLAATPPFFVVTHRPPVSVRLGLQFTFSDDLRSTLARARSAAGGKDVVVMGGGSVIGQCLAEGLVDELSLHITPIILGAGTPVFLPDTRCALVQRTVRVSPNAAHVTYEVGR